MIDKLQKVTRNADDDDCTYFTLLARKGNKNTQYPYPKWKIGSDIALYFRNPDRPFNPAAIAYSLEHNHVKCIT